MRKLRAVQNKDTILSFIIDGMDQSHSTVPYLGTQASFASPLKQHIQGVMVHGKGMMSYFGIR